MGTNQQCPRNHHHDPPTLIRGLSVEGTDFVLDLAEWQSLPDCER